MKPICRLFILACWSLLAACSILSAAPDEITRLSRDYTRQVRWQELDPSGAPFIDKKLSPDFQARVTAAKDSRVVDYRILGVSYDREKKEADVRVEFDYYALPSLTLKTVLDVQKWVYRDTPGEQGWRLTSLIPEFR